MKQKNPRIFVKSHLFSLGDFFQKHFPDFMSAGQNTILFPGLWETWKTCEKSVLLLRQLSYKQCHYEIKHMIYSVEFIWNVNIENLANVHVHMSLLHPFTSMSFCCYERLHISWIFYLQHNHVVSPSKCVHFWWSFCSSWCLSLEQLSSRGFGL